MLDAAVELYNRKNRTRGELVQSKQIFLELLEDRVERLGANHGDVGFIHWYLGLVYTEMDDMFDEGEAHYLKAYAIYSQDDHKASIATAHANLLVKKAHLILEEAADLKEDAREKPAVSKVKKLVLRAMRKPEITEDDLQTLRSLADTNEEAMECFKKAAELREQVANLRAEIAKKAAKKKKADTRKAAAKPQAEPIVYRSPAEIYAVLDRVVIGQYAAKRGLANAASQHLRRMNLSAEELASTDKSNVIISGPTGCGKTLLAQGLAGAINAPYYKTEATKLTASGYVGEDVNAILFGLLRAADFDVERAQKGIIYLDEIDKIAAAGDSTSLDVGGESVQEELLTILEGTVVSVPKDGNKRSQGEMIEIDTTNILFILGGAFTRLGEIVYRRKAGSGIGFGATLREKETDFGKYQKDAGPEDFIKCGMIPEFIGRLPIRLVVETLTVNQLERILVEPVKALVPQKVLLLASTTNLIFTKGALRTIAEEARTTGTNARALREIIEQVLAPVIFEEPKVAIITADMVKNRKAEIASEGHDVPVIHQSACVIDDGDVERVRAAAVEKEAKAGPTGSGAVAKTSLKTGVGR